MQGHWVVRLPTWLGDTVMAVPTIRALARGVDRITLWGSEPHLRLLRYTGVAGDRLPFARRHGPAAVLDVARAARSLAGIGADGALLLPNAFEPAATAWVACVRRRVGYATDGRGPLLTDPIPPPAALSNQHDAEHFAGLLSALRLPPPHPQDTLLEIPRRSDPASRLLGNVTRPLGIVPGCANGPAKRWPAAAFARLADRAARRWGATPILLGGNQDIPAATAVESACQAPCLNLTGRTDVLELAAVLGACRAVVSNDTGAAHLAAALSSPTVQLFGPTDPVRSRARGPYVRVASSGAFCQPCMAKVCPLDHRCMQGMTTDLVFGVLEQLWDHAPAIGTS